jgi:hypothetical protein
LLRQTRGGGPSWDDSRRHPRFAAAAEGHLQVTRASDTISEAVPSQTILLRDLSRGGLRFLHGEKLYPGDLGSVQFATGASLPLRVVWCRRLERGVFMSGCRFNGKPAIAESEGDSFFPSTLSADGSAG